jgi:hypothetical protein
MKAIKTSDKKLKKKLKATLGKTQRRCIIYASPNAVSSKYYAPPNINIQSRISDHRAILSY